jgi:transposase
MEKFQVFATLFTLPEYKKKYIQSKPEINSINFQCKYLREQLKLPVVYFLQNSNYIHVYCRILFVIFYF